MKHFVIPSELSPTSSEIDAMFSIDTGIGEEAVVTELTDLAALAAEAGIFPSRGQARKNGLSGPPPHGLSLFGTKKKRFWVWAPDPPSAPLTFRSGFDHTERWMRKYDAAITWAEPLGQIAI